MGKIFLTAIVFAVVGYVLGLPDVALGTLFVLGAFVGFVWHWRSRRQTKPAPRRAGEEGQPTPSPAVQKMPSPADLAKNPFVGDIHDRPPPPAY